MSGMAVVQSSRGRRGARWTTPAPRHALNVLFARHARLNNAVEQELERPVRLASVKDMRTEKAKPPLANAGVDLVTLARIIALENDEAVTANLFTGAERRLPCRSLVIVGQRRAHDELYMALTARPAELKAAGILGVDRIGDALAPGAIVHATYSGHRYAREFDGVAQAAPYTRDAPFTAYAPANSDRTEERIA